MPDLIDRLGGLRPDERRRLDVFAGVFEHIDASQYVTFADVPSLEDVEPAE
jgi:hypothetical protein